VEGERVRVPIQRGGELRPVLGEDERREGARAHHSGDREGAAGRVRIAVSRETRVLGAEVASEIEVRREKQGDARVPDSPVVPGQDRAGQGASGGGGNRSGRAAAARGTFILVILTRGVQVMVVMHCQIAREGVK